MRPAVDIMADEVRRYEGTIAQLAGDGLTALFGAPLAHEDDPQRALCTAAAIKRRLSEYEKRLKTRGLELTLRAGANTGLIKVEGIGDDLSMSYTPLGDTVNLASQLKSAAAPGEVLVSETALRLAEGYFEFVQAGAVEVEGRKHPIWNLISPGRARTRISASLARGLSPFVGRERELEHLAHSYERVKEGSGQVVGVVGEPGMGKSRLLLEFRKALPEEDYTYLEGGCIHYGEAIAYLPILDILRDYFDIGEGEDEESSKRKVEERLAPLDGQLSHILPPLEDLLSLPVGDESYLSLEPAQRRERVFGAIHYLLTAESRKRPLIVVVEDLHWMDNTSEDFLSHFIEGLPASAILLLLLHRPEYSPAWAGKTYYRQILVDHLPERPSMELVQAILSGGEVARELNDFIVAKTAGNPLFIEELTRCLLESGSIVKEGESYALSSEPSLIKVPATVQGIIASRLDRLPAEEKETLQVAAVIGREFSLRLLEEVTGITKPLKSTLHALQSLEFVYEKSLFPEPEYLFKHALTQEVAYESLPLKRRRELHERIGQAIETLYPERLEDFYETLAHHYSRSENADKAVHYLRLSGDRAARDYANWEAIRFYEEAIRILDSQPQSEYTKRAKLDIFISVQNSLLLLGFPEGSVESLEEAEKLAEELGDDERLAAVFSKFSLYYSLKGNLSLSMEHSEKCFDTAAKLGDVDTMGTTAFDLGPVMSLTGRFVEMATISRRVIELLEEQHREKDLLAGGLYVFINQCGYCLLSLGVIGELAEARTVFEKGLRLALEVDDAFGTGWMEYYYSLITFWEGDSNKTIEHARKATERWQEAGIEILLGMVWALLGMGYCFLGEYEDAEGYAERGLEIQERSGIPAMIPMILYLLALIRLAKGDLNGAIENAGNAVRLSRDSQARSNEALALMVLGRIAGEVDKTSLKEAEEQIRQAISLGEEMSAKLVVSMGYLFLGEVFELAGHREEAHKNLRRAEEMYLEVGVVPDSYWLARTREALARLGQG